MAHGHLGHGPLSQPSRGYPLRISVETSDNLQSSFHGFILRMDREDNIEELAEHHIDSVGPVDRRDELLVLQDNGPVNLSMEVMEGVLTGGRCFSISIRRLRSSSMFVGGLTKMT